jgi:hypothetical protein
MNLNALCSGTPERITSRKPLSGGAQWLTDIICHLRDDVAIDNPAQALPQNGDIQSWVAESYYPGLQELTWEEAILSLLSRMQRCTSGRQPCKTDFAEAAMIQLKRATQSSQIWRV